MPKNREGVREGEEPTFGPQSPAGTRWVLVRASEKLGYELTNVTAPTAFLACASIGWAMSELVLAPKRLP